MKLPFAVTPGPRLQPRRPHRCLAHRARRLRGADGALRQRLPRRARTSGRWLYDAESGGAGYEAAWRRSWRPTRSRPSAAGSATTRARPPATAATSTRRSASTPSSGSSATRRWTRAGASRSPPRPPGGGCWSSAPGPAGLSAAYHLARRGHAVTIRESAPVAGGMMRYGIPRYRLPREVLDAEIDRLLALGVTLEVDTPVTDLDAVMADEGWDAVFLAVGAQLGHRTYLPAASAAQVLDAVSLLHGLEDGERPLLGRRVAVYGGGNTAVDAARTARRLGASDAVVVYRRTRERMPAHAEEVAEAEEEGVVFHWLSTIDRVEPDGLVIEQMELDEDGFPQPTGRTERLAADSVVLALGQDTDLSFLGDASALQVSRRHDRHGLGLRHDPHRRLRRRRRGGGGAVGDDRHRARSPGGREHRRLAGRASARTRPCGRPGAVRGPQHLVLRGRRPHPPPAARAGPAQLDLRRGGARPRRATRRSSRPGAACRAGAASPATTATRCAPTTPSSSSARPASTSSTSTTARAAGCASRSARPARS